MHEKLIDIMVICGWPTAWCACWIAFGLSRRSVYSTHGLISLIEGAAKRGEL